MEQNNAVQVLLPLFLPGTLTYAVPDGMQVQPGMIVEVPLGGKTAKGVVWSLGSPPAGKPMTLKKILRLLPAQALQPSLMKLVDWAADYTLSSPGTVLKMVLSVPAALEPPKEKKKKPTEHATDLPMQPLAVQLSHEQQEAAEDLCHKVASHSYSTTLLDGVTGSGKTEVYFTAIAEALKEPGAQILIMLPEIALTTQVVARFEAAFGFAPHQWHSGLTPAVREKYWREIAAGQARLVIGARSALFLPYAKLRLMIVDEEHDASYKQEEGVMYHARDMAVVRGTLEPCPVVLASATPSIETVENVRAGKYHCLKLPSRFGQAVLPDIKVVDMRKEKLPASRWLSAPLTKALTENLARGNQSLLFLNRRGYAPLTLCRECGYRFQCPECSSWLVEHKSHTKLLCHHCGYQQPVPKACPECHKEDMLVPCGPGVERIAEEVAAAFPNASVCLMTSDNLTSFRTMGQYVQDITDGKVDIIIGTQVIAKGYHFPRLTQVGVIDADLGMEGGDLRAGERTYQLLQQVAGRAGREAEKGTVILQSYMPENAVIHALAAGKRDAFLEAETNSRRRTNMPPFARMAAVIVSGKREAQVVAIARAIAAAAPVQDTVRVLGPVPAPIYRLRGHYRMRLLVKTSRQVHMQKWLRQWLARVKVPSAVKVKVDVDPYSFM